MQFYNANIKNSPLWIILKKVYNMSEINGKEPTQIIPILLETIDMTIQKKMATWIWGVILFH